MNAEDRFQLERKELIRKKQGMSDEEILEEVTQIEMKRSILLMSGGLDTTTLLYWLKREMVPLHVLSFDYGQEAKKEIEVAKRHCDRLNVSHEVIKIGENGFSGSLQVGGDHIHDDRTMVPSRNTAFLSIGICYALEHGFERIYYGATDGVSPDYLDCMPSYVHQFNILCLASDLNVVQIRAPLMKKTKPEIVNMALDFGIDLRDTWSCYFNGERPCGVCSGCMARKRYEREVKGRLNRKLFLLNKCLNYYDK